MTTPMKRYKMKTILVIGAGKSSSTLIKYLIDNAEEQGWKVLIADQEMDVIIEKTKHHSSTEAFELDMTDENLRRPLIERSDVVISMLPARFHIPIIKDCILYKKDVITPSYVTDEIKELDKSAREAGVLIMNELGLDPGIDHMSAMRIIDRIKEDGGELRYFESFTGGLVAPESDDNPWNYKFTWNPRNVVLAGQGSAAKFIQRGIYKYIPYNRLFRRSEYIDIEGYGKFEGYANRDSLKYRSIYGIDDIPTMYRGTLRRVGFSRAWNYLVQLGATDDSYIMEGSANMTHRDFVNSFLAYNPYDSVELKFRYYMKIDQDDDVWEKLEWLGLFENTEIGLKKDATPAQILQKIMEKKMNLSPSDKDMIVMYHKIGYKKEDVNYEIKSWLVVIGKDQTYTAMSDTVGLPLGIFTKALLNGSIPLKGVHFPIQKEVYEPVLDELETYGLKFSEAEFITSDEEAKFQ
jgi:saccharopine dehydrogenase-like NADP-dependent oxidoreductase